MQKLSDSDDKVSERPPYRLRPLLSAQEIALRIEQLAEEIAAVYGGHEIALVPILSGSLIFVADLVRRLPLDMVIHVCGLSSYRGQATCPGTLNWTLPPPDGLAGLHVLVVDDIVDSGGTLRRVCQTIARQGPASVRTCVLLARQDGQVAPDFLGFRVGPGFVVGYGLDYNGRFRNRPDIAVLDPAPVDGPQGVSA